MKIKNHIPTDIREYDWIPSVTWVLSMLELDSFNEIKKLPNFDKIMKDASTRGTYIHKFIELDLQWKNPKVAKKYMDYIKQWIIYKNSSTIWIFKNAKHEVFYSTASITSTSCDVAGTIDYTESDDSVARLIDWKTSSSKIPNPELITKYKLQLWGYRFIYRMNNREQYVDRGEIVIFSPKGIYIISMTEYDLDEYEDAFRSLYDIYNKLKNWKTIPKWINIWGEYVEVMKDKSESRDTILVDTLPDQVQEQVLSEAAQRLQESIDEFAWTPTSWLMEWMAETMMIEWSAVLDPSNWEPIQRLDMVADTRAIAEWEDPWHVYTNYRQAGRTTQANGMSPDIAIVDEATDEPEMPF